MNRWLIIAAAVIALATAAIVGWLWHQHATRPASYQSHDLGVRFDYARALAKLPLTSEHQRGGTVLRLANPPGQTPELLITLRSERGLKTVAAATKRDLRTTLLASLDKSYPQRYPGYVVLSRRNFDLNSHLASETVFSYEGPSGQLVRQQFWLVVLDDDRALYLSAQGKDDHFVQLKRDYFNALFASVRVN